MLLAVAMTAVSCSGFLDEKSNPNYLTLIHSGIPRLT